MVDTFEEFWLPWNQYPAANANRTPIGNPIRAFLRARKGLRESITMAVHLSMLITGKSLWKVPLSSSLIISIRL